MGGGGLGKMTGVGSEGRNARATCQMCSRWFHIIWQTGASRAKGLLQSRTVTGDPQLLNSLD
jgi:hypothetical protein